MIKFKSRIKSGKVLSSEKAMASRLLDVDIQVLLELIKSDKEKMASLLQRLEVLHDRAR
jgi:hypothetical protein